MGIEDAALWVIALRLIAPLLILRFPIAGTFLCMAIDFMDFGFIGSYQWYQLSDRFLDYYYLSFCLYIAFSWKDLFAKNLAIYLYLFRLVGGILMVITGEQGALLAFPNLFEPFFIFYLLYIRFAKTTTLFTSPQVVAVVVGSLLIPKLIQEYALHVHVPAPHLTPEPLALLLGLPVVILALLWLVLPVSALTWCIMRAKLPHDQTSLSKL